MFWWQSDGACVLVRRASGSWTEKKGLVKTVSARALSSFNRAAKAREEFL